MPRRHPSNTARRLPPPEPDVPRQRRRGLRFAVLGLAAVALFGLGVLTGARVLTGDDPAACAERYRYVNATFACGVQPVIGKGGYVALRSRLVTLGQAEVAAGRASAISVYFRDLRNGPVFGINELATFAPASLLKLPLAIAFLNAEENLPGFIERRVTYSGGLEPPVQTIPTKANVQAGHEYTLATLLRNTLEYSDNVSYLILRQYIRGIDGGEPLFRQTYQELGIIPPDGMMDQTVNVQGYASLLRQLYNATYLRPDLSELALSWLARSDFRDALVAGVPAGVAVAHKFGERAATDGSGRPLVEFHDCGIVYYPGNPYLLCVMTRGEELPELIEIVRGISQRVYEEVDARRIAPTGATWSTLRR
jgi:beta-lactamase class A